MSNRSSDESFERLAKESEERAEEHAPSKLKARLYSALIARQQQDGPLSSLTRSAAEGGKLCIFEQLVQIAPVGETAKSLFYCTACHARVLAEHFENPPIYWSGCPYVRLKNE